MSDAVRPTGHLQVKIDWNGRSRSFYAYWRDQHGERGGCRLGPAHVRDSGRRTSRGAVIWRAGTGKRPTSEHLTPRDAENRLATILRELEAKQRIESCAWSTRRARGVIYDEPGVARRTLAEGPARSRGRPGAAPVRRALWPLAPADDDPR